MYLIFHLHINLAYFIIILLLKPCLTNGYPGGGIFKTAEQRIPVVVPVSQLKESLQVPVNDVFITSYPAWVNVTLLSIGQAFTRHNFVEFVYATALAGGILANTDATRIFLGVINIMNPDKARKRYLSNTVHFKYWSIVDLDNDPENLFESLNLVHAIHVKAVHNTSTGWSRHRYNKPIIPNSKAGQNPYNVNSKVWTAFQIDLVNSRFKNLLQTKTQPDEPEHPPVNQFAFLSSFWAFVHAMIVSPEHALVYNASEEELMGFLHYWAFIGAAMGIDDKYNICLQPNLKVAKQYFTKFMEIYVLPPALHWDYEYKVFAERTFKALQELIPFAPGAGGMFYRICADLLLISCPNVYRSLTPQERMYNMAFGLPAHSLLRFNSIKSSIRFIWNGLIQIGGIKYYNFNTLDYANFTAGLHAMDEENLRGSYDLFFDYQNDIEYNK